MLYIEEVGVSYCPIGKVGTTTWLTTFMQLADISPEKKRKWKTKKDPRYHAA